MPKLRVKDPQNISCCCGSNTECRSQEIELTHLNGLKWAKGSLITPAGPILQVSTALTLHDRIGSWKARWGIGRMNYKIDPGLYCVGTPDNDSPVLVTANYKMSFDSLRRELDSISAWIVVLDTKGINVWCAAGKGTFGTDEIVKRLSVLNLSKIVSHRTIILPQLGAPGVQAHEVQKRSGFKVVYGPVKASDIKEFLSSGMNASMEMRTVKFSFLDRLVLVPMEIVGTIKISFIIFGVLFVLNSIGFGHFGFTDLYAYVGSILAGCAVTPLLLPWIPGRAFAFKGWLLGLLWSIAVILLNSSHNFPAYALLKALSGLLILPAISGYCAMNFTGCSTYTSLSGVKQEMKTAIPLLITSAGLGILAVIIYDIIEIIIRGVFL
jgi:hypothetical protein